MDSGQIKLNTSSLLTETQVIEIARQALLERELVYDQANGLWPSFHGKRKIRTGEVIPHWTVAYSTPAREVEYQGDLHEIAEQHYFAVVHDATGEFLYSIHATGYLE